MGLIPTVANALIENSYLVDSSVTPFVSWSTHKGIPDGKGGPDFLDYTPYPFNYEFPGGSIKGNPNNNTPTRFPLNTNWRIGPLLFPER